MTTIAYKDGVLAADTQCTMDGLRRKDAGKIVRLTSGALLGMSGDVDQRALITLLKDIKTEKGIPTTKALIETGVDCSDIFILPKGKIVLIHITQGPQSSSVVEFLDENYVAVGSGEHIALAMLDAGKSAVEAVRAACKRDIYSSLPIIKLEL